MTQKKFCWELLRGEVAGQDGHGQGPTSCLLRRREGAGSPGVNTRRDLPPVYVQHREARTETPASTREAGREGWEQLGPQPRSQAHHQPGNLDLRPSGPGLPGLPQMWVLPAGLHLPLPPSPVSPRSEDLTSSMPRENLAHGTTFGH